MVLIRLPQIKRSAESGLQNRPLCRSGRNYPYALTDGLDAKLRKPNEDMQICSFLWFIMVSPVSCYEGRNVEEVRFMSGYKMGRPMSRKWTVACGIPHSGVGMALGYTEGKVFLSSCHCTKYTPTWLPVSFTPSNQAYAFACSKNPNWSPTMPCCRVSVFCSVMTRRAVPSFVTM